MDRPGTDRFLTCVVRRSERDSIIRIGALILIMIVVPVFAILLTLDLLWVYNRFIADPTDVIELPNFIIEHMDDFVGAHLMEYTIGTFILYLVFNTYLNHCKRDHEWMESLIEYVDSYGRDTSVMRRIRNEADVSRTRNVTKGFLIWFIIVLLLCMMQALFISLRDMQPDLAVMVINILILVTILQLSFTSIYIYIHIFRHTKLQHEFTESFKEQMSEEFPKLETIGELKQQAKLWQFVLLMVVTLGFYSIISALWSIHLMNDHIRDEWEYEEMLLRSMAAHEGAIGVEKVFSEKPKTFIEKAWMVFTR